MKKRISLLILIICMVGGIVFFFPKKNTQEVKMVKKKQTPEISFYHQEYKERYDTYQKAHQDLSKKEVITLVNMNRDFDFYGKIIKQEHPNDLNTIVNKYYQLDETYEPSDLVEINTNAGTYGSSYSKHTARKVVYDDFQALKQACINLNAKKGGTCIAMNPKTGKILAMADYPDYNLNTPFTPNDSLSKTYNSLSSDEKNDALHTMWKWTLVPA